MVLVSSTVLYRVICCAPLLGEHIFLTPYWDIKRKLLYLPGLAIVGGIQEGFESNQIIINSNDDNIAVTIAVTAHYIDGNGKLKANYIIVLSSSVYVMKVVQN